MSEQAQLTTIEVTLLNQTYRCLQKDVESLELSIGEVIDRMVLSFQCSNPNSAALLACEQLICMTSQLTDEQIIESIISAVIILMQLLAENNISQADLKKVVEDKILKEGL